MIRGKKNVENRKSGIHPATGKTGNEIRKLSFSIAVLIVQLHKYSSYVHDNVSLQLKFIQSNYFQLVKIKYALKEDSTFNTLFRKLDKKIQESLRLCPDVERVKTEIQWIVDGEHGKSTHLCKITTLRNKNREVKFQCSASSFFKTVFKKAEVHHKILSAWVSAYPQSLIKDIHCLTPEEVEEMKSFEYGPVLASDEILLLHSLFEQTVQKYPQRIAISHEGRVCTYEILKRKANRLAQFLIKTGIGPGDFVGIMLNRSAEAYVSMLGILKAGAAYIPLDTDFPEERVRYILKDSSAKYLISGTEFKKHYAQFSGTVYNVNAELIPVLLNSLNDDDPQVDIDPSSPAYLIYTSGTTGRPKGVVVSHAAANNLVKVEKDIFKLSPDDKVLQGFSIAFDASIEEIWLAFLSGATLFPADKQVMYSGSDLSEFINREKITVLSTVPTLLSTMQPSLPSLKLLILGGEACSHELLTLWHNNGLRIVNTYGPTEATVITTYADFNPAEKITIGNPVSNYAVFITDSSINQVPVGVPGELCIAGDSLAEGYLNNEELTAEKFICAPFHIHAFPNRIYRTGDLARFNERGQIEFLGRIDSQVKLRGYRIELAEIESLLLQVENIKNAVVAVKEDELKIERLIAYIVLKEESNVFDETACRTFLQTRLAPYMIPSLFVKIQEVPTLSSGKADRKQLPEPTFNNEAESERIILEPRDILEKEIHKVWTKYFSPHPVSVTDDFFLDLGGHSLLVAKVVSELRQQTYFSSLSVLDVYKKPTIEKLASSVKSRSTISQNGYGSKRKEEPRYEPSRLKHFCCGVLQFFSLYFVFAFSSVMIATGYLVYFYFELNGHSWIESVAWALSSSLVVYPAILVLAVSVKWILLGRIKQGRYKLWGWFYLRWWFVQNIIHVLGLGQLAGTPLLPLVYRLLGMKVGKDVHLETDHFAAFDLISIGDNSTVDENVKVRGFSVKDGYLIVGSVTIGQRCFIGERSVVGENTVMENDARLEDLSLLPSGSQIRRGETWAGSPAQFIKSQSIKINPPVHGSVYVKAITGLYAALFFIIPAVTFLAFIPGIAFLFQFDPIERPFSYLAILPLAGASFVILLTIEIVLLKWILVGRVRPGTYPVHGGFYIRNWIVDQLMKISLHHVGQLRATLYVASWYRALGTKIGKFVELSTANSTTPDLIHLSDGCTVADEVSLGSPHIEGGWMTVAPVKLGCKAFLGNSAVVPIGREMGDGSLVGVLSVAPNTEDAKRKNATWFGSPPILFPKRETSDVFSEERTYRPSNKLRLARGSFELLRIVLPPCGFIVVTVSMIVFAIHWWEQIGLVWVLALLPVVFAASSTLVILTVVLLKWIFIGQYKPFVKPLWSNLVWRLEFVNALYEFLAAPLILELLQGTPFLPWYLRLLGARIGNQCYIDTTGFLEWDMVEIGDRVAIGEDAVMQTHLFEDRILKASNFKIGHDCSVGSASVVLYDTTMEDASQLDALSLLMKGEVLPSNTKWQGIPATRKENTASSLGNIHHIQ